MNEAEEKALRATGEKIVRDLDGFLLAAFNIYDVAKVIPHPYDAIGDMGSSFLHDFRGFAFTVDAYVKRVKDALDTLPAEPADASHGINAPDVLAQMRSNP